MIGKAEVKSNFCQHFTLYQGASPVGKFTFRVGVGLVEEFGNTQFQNGITQKLEPFIVLKRKGPMFIQIGTMYKSLLEQFLVRKMDTSLVLEINEITIAHRGE